MARVNLNDLIAFIAVAREWGFARAAAQMCLSSRRSRSARCASRRSTQVDTFLWPRLAPLIGEHPGINVEIDTN